MIYVNPAYAALPSSGEVGLTYRNQWPGIQATFVTYGATAVIPVKSLNSGIGVSFLNDMQGSGVINNTSASLLYGYLFHLNSSWQVGVINNTSASLLYGYLFHLNSSWQVSAGISASYVFKKFSADQLVFKSDILNDLGYSFGTVVFDNYTVLLMFLKNSVRISWFLNQISSMIWAIVLEKLSLIITIKVFLISASG